MSAVLSIMKGLHTWENQSTLGHFKTVQPAELLQKIIFKDTKMAPATDQT